MTTETIKLYIAKLSAIPIEELAAIVDTITDQPGSFIPSIGDIKEMQRKLHHHVDPSKAEAGWESVQRAIRGVGSWGTPRFKDPITQRVVQAMGWLELCSSDVTGVDRAHFIKFYNAFASGEVSEQRLTPEYRALRTAYHEDRLLAGDGHLLTGDTE